MNNLMYRPTDFFMIRRPLFPFYFYKEIFDYTSNDITLTRKNTVDNMLKFCLKSEVIEALLVSSPTLVSSLSNFHSLSQKKQNQVIKSIMSYIIRMTTRPTPFGLMSGISVGEISNKNNIVFDDINEFLKVAKPDSEWIYKLILLIESDLNIVKKLKVSTNPMIFCTDTHVKLPYKIGDQEDSGKWSSSTIKKNLAVDYVIEKAMEPIQYQVLLQTIAENFPSATNAIADKFLIELIRNEYLLCELRAVPFNHNSLELLIGALKKIDGIEGITNKLIEISNMFDEYNNDFKIGRGDKILTNLSIKMNEIINVKAPIQVDMLLSMKQNILDQKIANEVTEALDILIQITYKRGGNRLGKFKKKFYRYYETYKEVPLTAVINNDYGLDIQETDSIDSKSINGNGNDHILESLLLQASHIGKSEIVLDEYLDTFSKIEQINPTPLSAEIYFTIATKSIEEMAKGNYKLIFGPNYGTSGIGKSFARFNHLLDARTLSKLKEVELYEESLNPDIIFAEVSHAPINSRFSNVLSTLNHTKEYEIPLGNVSSKTKDKTIPLSDLLVGINNHNQLYLKSKSLNKEVIPTFTNVFNPLFAPPIYRFLYEIAMDRYGSWNKPDVVVPSSLCMIPRVRYKNVILSLATWKINRYTEPLKKGLSEYEWVTRVTEWKRIYKIPRYIYLTKFDNRLLLDLDHSLHTLELQRRFEKLENNEELIITETGFDDIQQTNGFQVEVVLPLQKALINMNELRVSNKNYPFNNNEIHKKFLPGDEWLYVKLYCSKHIQDELLTIQIRQLTEMAYQNNWIEKSFFIRYADPNHHIRLRFRGKKEILMSCLLPEISRWSISLKENGIIASVTFEAYVPEIERYGGPLLIDLAENIFSIDSEMIYKWLLQIKGSDKQIFMEKIGVISILNYLDSFLLTKEEQLNLLNQYTSHREYLDYFGKVKNEFLVIASDRNNFEHDQDLSFILNGMEKRNNATKVYARKIIELNESKKLFSTFEDIIRSILHIHINRLYGMDREVEIRIITLCRHILKYLIGIEENQNKNIRWSVKQ